MSSILITNGSENHPTEQYAMVTAGYLLPSDGLNPKGIDPKAVQSMQFRIASALWAYFEEVKQAQRAALAHRPDVLEWAADIEGLATNAARSLQDLSEGSFWESVTHDAQWLVTAINTIGSNLTTAAHVENLLHADRHPDIAEAKSYKTKYQGS